MDHGGRGCLLMRWVRTGAVSPLLASFALPACGVALAGEQAGTLHSDSAGVAVATAVEPV